MSAQQTYILKGTVYDSTLNQPVEGAQVWLYGEQIGDISDSLGQFKFDVYTIPANTRDYVRACGKEIDTSKLIDFGTDTLIQTKFFISNTRRNCSSPPRIPWKVKPSESEEFSGHLILAGGGSSIEMCNGKSYVPAWPKDFSEKEIWSSDSKVGDRLYIKLRGRLDPFSQNVVPYQTLYVGEVDTIKTAEKNDCSL